MLKLVCRMAALSGVAWAAEGDPEVLWPGSITDFRLSNGMRFLLVERHQAPLISFHFRVRAGLADSRERPGIATLFAQMFEHGSEGLGSRSPAAEKAALAEAEKAMNKMEAAGGGDRRSIEAMQADIQAKMAVEHLAGTGSPSFFHAVLAHHGASGVSARASADTTGYSVTLPSHKMEVWFRLMSDFVKKPAYRRFYWERWTLEQALKAQQSVDRRAEETLLSVFRGHPYGSIYPDAEQLAKLRVSDAEQFRKSYYHPGNFVAALVGDVTAAEARRLAEAYFGKLPAGAPVPEEAEPPVVIEAKPLQLKTRDRGIVVGWLRPAGKHGDSPALDLVLALMNRPGQGGLQQELCSPGGVAVSMRARGYVPGERYSSLFVVEGVLARSKTHEDAVKALDSYIEKLAKETTEEELTRTVSLMRMDDMEALESGAGLAAHMARVGGEYDSLASYKLRAGAAQTIALAYVRRVLHGYLAPGKRVELRLEAGAAE